MIEKVKKRCDPAGKADYKEGRIVLSLSQEERMGAKGGGSGGKLR